MKTKYAALRFQRILGGLVLSSLLTLPVHAQATPTIYISEINWSGSEASLADEWIELANPNDYAVDVSNWILTGVATSNSAIQLEVGTMIEPRSTLLIANYAFGDEKTTLNTSPDLVTTSISLPNSNLEILLADPDGLVIDSYSDSGTPDYGSSSPHASISRNPVDLSWQTSELRINLANSTQFGSPGVIDDPNVPDTEDSTVVVDEIVSADVTSLAETDVEEVNSPTLPGCNDPQLVENSEDGGELDTTTTEIETPEVISSSSNSVIEEIDAPQPGQIVINELVSDPDDGVEWVELKNVSGIDLDLTGLTLRDASLKATALPELVLRSGQFYVVENPSGKLNNDGDTVQLVDQDGDILDQVTYGSGNLPVPRDGDSLARKADDSWEATSPTKGGENHITLEILDTDQADNSTDDETVDEPLETETYETPTINSNPSIDDTCTPAGTVEKANQHESEGAEPIHRIVAVAKSLTGKTKTTSKVTEMTSYSGPVVALPNTFGKQIMFIDGHEIYFYAADWPQLNLGDVVQVTGTLTTNSNASRLKISSAEDIEIIDHVELVAEPVDGQEFLKLSHGQFVSIAGDVIGKNGNELKIKTADGQVITVLGNKKLNVTWSGMQAGTIIVSGIVKHNNHEVQLAVRAKDDVHFTPATPITTGDHNDGFNAKSNKPWVGGGLLTGSFGALGTWYLRSRKNIHLPF